MASVYLLDPVHTFRKQSLIIIGAIIVCRTDSEIHEYSGKTIRLQLVNI